MAQTFTLDLGQGAGVTERALQLVALITILSLAPSILVMVTSFTRIVVVLSLLRTAIGTQHRAAQRRDGQPRAVPDRLHHGADLAARLRQGIQPLLANQITPEQAFERATAAVQDLHAEATCARRTSALHGHGATSRARPRRRPCRCASLIPAFMISELQRAFEIGFLLFLPFLIIDLVVASILMSMGMMMLPPVTVSLPFKLIFFVLVDGWNLVAGSLVQSYGT